MSLYLEVAELAGELRLSVSDAALSDADDPSTLPEEWEHVARSTAWKLGVVYRDMQARATPDSVAEFWEKQTNQPPGRDAAPTLQALRLGASPTRRVSSPSPTATEQLNRRLLTGDRPRCSDPVDHQLWTSDRYAYHLVALRFTICRGLG